MISCRIEQSHMRLCLIKGRRGRSGFVEVVVFRSSVQRSVRASTLALALVASALVVGQAAFAQGEADHGVSRLFVADASSHVVSVFDPESRQRIASFGTPGTIGNVYPSSTGRWVFVVHTDANRVSI